MKFNYFKQNWLGGLIGAIVGFKLAPGLGLMTMVSPVIGCDFHDPTGFACAPARIYFMYIVSLATFFIIGMKLQEAISKKKFINVFIRALSSIFAVILLNIIVLNVLGAGSLEGEAAMGIAILIMFFFPVSVALFFIIYFMLGRTRYFKR